MLGTFSSGVPLWALISALVGVVGAAVLILAACARMLVPGQQLQEQSTAAAGTQLMPAPENLHVGDAVALFGACSGMIALQYVARKAPMLGSRLERLQLPRRVQHASSGVAIVMLYLVLPRRVAIGALGTGFAALGLLQALRHMSRAVDAQFIAAFGTLLREEERRGAPPAALGFLGGSLFCAAFLPRRVCLAAILGAALGDPAAAIVGGLLGGPRLVGKKTLSGFLACFSIAGACGAIIHSGGVTIAAMSFALCGLTTAVAELLGGLGPLGDDNFAVLFGAPSALILLRELTALLDAPGATRIISSTHEALESMFSE